MSGGLFGDASPTESAPANSNSIFGSEPAAASTSSLFNDDDNNASPWSMPTPKKAARQNLLKSLLPATEVPESYVDAYDTTLEHESNRSGISFPTVDKIIRSSNLSTSDTERILGLIAPGGNRSEAFQRNEFNVLLALIGLAQEGEEISLDGVDERRRRKLTIKLETPCTDR
jgi:sorting nexin-8